MAESPQLPESLLKQQFLPESNSVDNSVGEINFEVTVPESAVKDIDDPTDYGREIGVGIAEVLSEQLERRGG